MSSKISLILSMVFVVMFFLFAGDMISLQFAYSNLDATSVTISHLIGESYVVDNAFISQVEAKYNITFILLSEIDPHFGDVVDYIIRSEYKSIVISDHSIPLSIKRSSVVGYYN